MANPSETMTARLEAERNIWLATLHPRGRPHLVPVWFVWTDGHIYLCVASTSVKVRNITANPAVSLALESGNIPVVVEGRASVVAKPWPDEAIAGFQQKYDWDITTDTEYDTLMVVTPLRWLMAQQ